MNHGKSQLCINIKHRTTKTRGLQRTASVAEEEDVDGGKRKQQRELGSEGGGRLSDRWEER